MSEEASARKWIADRFGVSRETCCAQFVEMVVAENERQNLISRATIAGIWHRHILDSAQLVPLATEHSGQWIDIGTGAGFPGFVTAILSEMPTILVEPRRKRAEFLAESATFLALSNVEVITNRVERMVVKQPVAIISARAVSNLSHLFVSARHLGDKDTLWLLPKGRSAQSEVDEAQQTWQGSFHVEQSLTNPESAIVVARGVRPK